MPSFVRALLWYIDIMLFCELRATVLFLVAPHRDECLEYPSRVITFLTVEQLLYWSDWICTGRAAQIEAKTKFRFGNIVLKQWTLSGFVQHTSANSMYKYDNKISRQQKVLHMMKMLERVPHFQTSFSVGIQPLFKWRNHRGNTHCVHHYPSINCIFSVFSNINGEHESTLTTSKNTHGANQYKRKLNL